MLPFGMFTVAGTETRGLFDVTLANEFPDAAVWRLIVPTADCPPTTLFGEIVRPERICGSTWSCAVSVAD